MEAVRLDEVAQRVTASSLGNGAHESAGHTTLHDATKTDLLPGESTGAIVISTAPANLGHITYASQVACRILGFSRQQVRRRERGRRGTREALPRPRLLAHPSAPACCCSSRTATSPSSSRAPSRRCSAWRGGSGGGIAHVPCPPSLLSPSFCSDHFIEQYLHTGRSAIVDRTRLMLAKHRNGHVIPVLVSRAAVGG